MAGAGEVGFDEGGVIQGFASVLEALSKEGIDHTVTTEKTLKSGKIRTTTTNYRISLVTPGVVIGLYLIIKLFEKTGKIPEALSDWVQTSPAGSALYNFYRAGMPSLGLPQIPQKGTAQQLPVRDVTTSNGKTTVRMGWNIG